MIAIQYPTEPGYGVNNGDSCRTLVIHDLQRTGRNGEKSINLAEINLFLETEQVSRQYVNIILPNATLPGSNCNDGDPNTNCATGNWTQDPVLYIEEHVFSNPSSTKFIPFDRVDILNTDVCCQENIVGATFSIRDVNGDVVWTVQPFTSAMTKYSIIVPKWVRIPFFFF